MDEVRPWRLGQNHAFVAADSSRYATAVVDRLTLRCGQIAAFPYSGHMVSEYARREIREVIEYSYRIIYLVDESGIWILAVIHGAKPLPDRLPVENLES